MTHEPDLIGEHDIGTYKVKVRCWHVDYDHPDRQLFRDRTFIVQTRKFSEDAMQIAATEAENTAEIGPKWIQFHAHEAVSITIPYEVR